MRNEFYRGSRIAVRVDDLSSVRPEADLRFVGVTKEIWRDVLSVSMGGGRAIGPRLGLRSGASWL